MKRTSIKRCGGQRKKALFGADGAITAAATLAAAGIQAAATKVAADKQAKAMLDNANTQANSIKETNANNTRLQKESIDFTRQQNAEARQQQQNIQTTLQMLAGQENMNDRMRATKVEVKYGGSKRKSIKSSPFYGGANQPFIITDGGGAVPLNIDNNGYGLYELYGNDHDHYHKTSSGKAKTGVGIKFPDGNVIEGEGNQNTNKGELMYVTPNDALFLSKHNINGFNPREAVLNGVSPQQAFNIQENIKNKKGINDDGTKAKCGGRRKLKKPYGGQTILEYYGNLTQSPYNNTGDIASGIIYATNNNNITSSPVEKNNTAKCGKRVSIKKCGGNRKKAKWGDYAGATYSTVGNLAGAALSAWGNNWAAGKLNKAYAKSAGILADAYNSLQTIDENYINASDYNPGHAMAVVRSANVNVNPQLENLRRNAASEARLTNTGTLSSAARQQRLAGINNRTYQKASEVYADKFNREEAIKQQNAQNITQTSQVNAQLDTQAKQAYAKDRLSLKQYNNDIINQRTLGAAEAKADANTAMASTSASAFQSSMGALGSALQASGNAFGTSFDAKVKSDREYQAVLAGADDASKVTMIIARNDKETARIYYDTFVNSTNPIEQKYAEKLNEKFKFNI